MCMEDLLPSLSVLLRCLRCVNFFAKNKRELSEYKAIGMIQDHVSLYIMIQRNTQNLTKILIRLFDLHRRMDGNLIDMRRKLSLILWVLSMSIMGLENKRKLHNFKMKLVRVFCVYFSIPKVHYVFLVCLNESSFCFRS